MKIIRWTKLRAQLLLIFISVFLNLFNSATNVRAENGAANLERALQTRDFVMDDAHDEFAKNSKIVFELPKRKDEKKVVPALVGILSEPVRYTYGKKGGVFSELLSKRDATVSGVRGAAHQEKPPGCYVGDFNIHYGSDYPKVPLPEVAQWAYDLHLFLQNNDGWYKRMSSSRYIRYADKEQFARQWFTRSNKEFGSLRPAAQAAFLHDAIEDGMVVYWFYETHKRQQVFERQTTWMIFEIRESEKRV